MSYKEEKDHIIWLSMGKLLDQCLADSLIGSLFIAKEKYAIGRESEGSFQEGRSYHLSIPFGRKNGGIALAQFGILGDPNHHCPFILGNQVEIP